MEIYAVQHLPMFTKNVAKTQDLAKTEKSLKNVANVKNSQNSDEN